MSEETQQTITVDWPCGLHSHTVAVTLGPAQTGIHQPALVDTLVAAMSEQHERECPCPDGHAWATGMVVIHDEDVETVARMRFATGEQLPECRRCGIEYIIP